MSFEAVTAFELRNQPFEPVTHRLLYFRPRLRPRLSQHRVAERSWPRGGRTRGSSSARRCRRGCFERRRRAHVEVQAVETDTGVAQIDSLRRRRSTRRRGARQVSTRTFDRRVGRGGGLPGEPTARSSWATSRLSRSRRRLGPACHRSRSGTSPGIGSTARYDDVRLRHDGAGGQSTSSGTRMPRPLAPCGCRSTADSTRWPAVTSDIPFIARRSTRDAAETRERLGIAGDRPFVLACFSGADLDLPYDSRRRRTLTVLAPEREAPAGLTISGSGGGCRRGREQARLRHRLGVHRQRDAAALHLARTIRRIRRVRRRDAARASLPLPTTESDLLAGRWARGRRAARAAAAAREPRALTGSSRCRWKKFWS